MSAVAMCGHTESGTSDTAAAAAACTPSHDVSHDQTLPVVSVRPLVQRGIRHCTRVLSLIMLHFMCLYFVCLFVCTCSRAEIEAVKGVKSVDEEEEIQKNCM